MIRARFLVLFAFTPALAAAGPATFALDAPASSVTVSGTVAGATIQQQGPGSLVTTYGGTFLTTLSPTSVQFVGGGAMNANNSGNWAPQAGGIAGTAPANYGGRVSLGLLGNGTFAIRGMSVDGSSDPLPLTGTAFPSAGPTIVILSGTTDFQSLLFTGTDDLAGDSGANASTSDGALTVAVNTTDNTATATLTLPLAASFTSTIAGVGDATINFNGQVRGTVSSIGGDTNFDKVVDIGDFATLAAGFNLPGNWLAGDFNDTGGVEIGDFAILAANFNRTAPADLPRSAVPEPAAAALAALLLAGWRRPVRHRAFPPAS